MKKNIITIICSLAFVMHSGKLIAQGLAINTTGASPASSSMLDVTSTSKGVLIPRMTALQVSSITSPATGLLVYVTDFPKGFYYYTGLDWVKFITKDENGNVPINATNAMADPSAALDVSSTNKGMLVPKMTAAQANSIGTPATGLLVYVTDYPKGFYQYNGVDWVKFITKDENGNVPINQSNANADPSAILHIQPDAGPAKGLLIPRLTAFQTAGIASPATGLLVYVTDNSKGFYYHNGVDWAKFVTADEFGNVGIGCLNPQYKLHVIGDIASSGTIRGVNAYVTGAITACSDLRYKKNIMPMQNSLEHVLKMQGVTYNWKTDEFPGRQFSNALQTGFVAQDMEKIFPGVVTTDIDGYKGIDYSRLSPVLVEAIKEQQQLIEKLETKNKILQDEISQVKIDLDRVKAAVGIKVTAALK